MAASNNKLADALAFQQERRKALVSADEALANLFANRQIQPEPELSTSDYLENLSSGLGRGFANQLEGTYQLARHPIESGKAMYQAGKQIAQNPAMLAEALKSVGQQATSGPLGLGQIAGEYINPRSLMPKPVIQEMTVYHGTPHRFPATESNPLGEFDASKIGTGEGAQAYGHGVYLAEAPGVAAGYKTRLSRSAYKDAASGEMIDSGNAWQKATKSVQDAGVSHPDRAGQIAEHIQDWVDNGRLARSFLLNHRVPKELEPAYEAAINSFENIRLNKGSLYHADLPDEMVDRMLDWDKPLSEQPESVRKSLQKAWPNIEDYSAKSGESLYQELSRPAFKSTPTSGMSRVEASTWLRQQGIPGIKYLDAGSRGANEKATRNFVVFPGEEKKVKILKRE